MKQLLLKQKQVMFFIIAGGLVPLLKLAALSF
jgi:hypothetical protein